LLIKDIFGSNFKVPFLTRMGLFNKSDFRSLYFLNATQFLGALNDNIFKLLIVYLLINVKGEQEASSILAIAGMVFVIPFLLFSNAAGVLADRLSKRNITVGTKAAEVAIMTLGTISIYFKWEFGSYFLLFLMATQSAAFGPSKFGIIPELVEEKKVSKANGLLASFTYLAIIFGTFLASFLTDVTNRNFVIVSLFCVAMAIVGLLTSIGIHKTPTRDTHKKINPFFIYEIYQTLKMASNRRHLFTAIIGSAFFLFLGGFVQMNIIPFGIQSLGVTETGGGYLFLTTAVGIALGATLAGKLSKDHVEPGISCISAFILSFLLLFLHFFSTSFFMVVTTLILLGVFGGLMLIPLDSFIQIASPDEKRGQVIAASNFLSFSGVLIASFLIYLFNEQLGFQASTSFALMSFITLGFSIFLTGRMGAYFFPYFMEKFIFRFQPTVLKSKLPSHTHILIVQSGKWKDVFYLFPFFKKLKILVPGKRFSRFPYFNSFLSSFRLVTTRHGHKETLIRMCRKAKKFHEKDFQIAFFLDETYSKEDIYAAYKAVFGRLHSQVLFIDTKKEEISLSPLQKLLHQKSMSIFLEK